MASPDFNKLGVGGEMVMPISGTTSIAARLGATHARAEQGNAVANAYALGAGITWGGGHGIDIAIERRAQKNSTTDEINHLSLAYSWQR